MVMNMLRYVFIVACISSLLLSSCSIKEDRHLCPCSMVLDFSEVDTAVVKYMDILVTGSNGVVLSDRVDARMFGEEYVREVPHEMLRVNVWSGGDRAVTHPHGLVIPYGCECPPLFMDSFMADASGEVCRDTVSLHKNHCGIDVMMSGAEQMPYSLTFSGEVDGYELDGKPSEGDFACVAYPVDGISHAVLPRQRDNSLLLNVDDGTGVTKTFALGEYIAGSGYDWTAADLEDITIVLDYYVTDVTISIKRWEEEFTYDVVF